MMQVLLSALVLLAGISPLLTFVRLFQLKEWRWDRLREHLRREGRLRQLFGIVRPAVTAMGIVLFFVFRLFLLQESVLADALLWITIGVLGWFTLFRFVIGRQARPVWTRKALLITSLSIFFYILLHALILLFFLGDEGDFWGVSTTEAFLSVLYPLFAFCIVFLVWYLLLPLDRFLKKRILTAARKLREELPNLTVIGITGSVGKTTTKELLSQLIADRKVLVTPAHVNTEMGVATLMLNKLTEEHQIFVVEMGAYRRGEITLLCALTKPHLGVITYIGRQHLGLFGSEEELCRAKGELFATLPANGRAFLNADTEHCEDLMKLARCPVHTVGTGGHATYEAFDIQENPNGVSFTLRGEPFFVPIQGTHQVTNVLLAVAVAEALGIPIAECAKRLRSFQPPPQTFEKKEGKSGQTVLDDTHNASPASFRAAIEWARAHPAQVKILVTCGLLELGKEEAAIHQELGQLSRGVFDEVVFLGKNCVRYFEQGYGKSVTIARRKKFRMKLQKDMLIVCEGRMPESIVQRLIL